MAGDGNSADTFRRGMIQERQIAVTDRGQDTGREQITMEADMTWMMAMTAMGTVSVLFAGFVLLVLRMDEAVQEELAGEDEARWISTV